VLGEGLVEVRVAVSVVLVDLLQFLEAQILRPGPVVERLGDDVPRSAVTLEFEDVDASLGIEGEEINESPEPGGYLPADDEQVGSGLAGILGDHVLEALLGVQRRRHQRARPVVGHPPDCHFDGHPPAPRNWKPMESELESRRQSLTVKLQFRVGTAEPAPPLE